jgi:hypothetical protein
MLFNELAQEEIYEAKLVYARKGRTIIRKYRCGSGRLKGKTVSTVNMKKRFTLARTKAKMGARMKRKSKMTRRMNPASKRLKTLNRR